MQKRCKNCDKKFAVYNTIENKCPRCRLETLKEKPPKQRKLIKKIGKNTLEWQKTRVSWLIKERVGGHWLCEECGAKIYQSGGVEYHHLKKRSTHPESRLVRDNCQRLCADCHREKHT